MALYDVIPLNPAIPSNPPSFMSFSHIRHLVKSPVRCKVVPDMQILCNLLSETHVPSDFVRLAAGVNP